MYYNYDKNNPFLPEGFDLHLAPLVANDAFNYTFQNLSLTSTNIKNDRLEITRDFNIISRVAPRIMLMPNSRLKIEGGALCFNVSPDRISPDSNKFIDTYLAFLGYPTFLNQFVYRNEANGGSRSTSQSSLTSSAYDSRKESIYEMPNFYTSSSNLNASSEMGSFVSNPDEDIYMIIDDNPAYPTEKKDIATNIFNTGNAFFDLVCLEYESTLNSYYSEMSKFKNFETKFFPKQQQVIENSVVNLIVDFLSDPQKILAITSRNPDPTGIAIFMEKILYKAMDDGLIGYTEAENFRARIIICASTKLDHLFNYQHQQVNEKVTLINEVLKTKFDRLTIRLVIFASAITKDINYFNENNIFIPRRAPVKKYGFDLSKYHSRDIDEMFKIFSFDYYKEITVKWQSGAPMPHLRETDFYLNKKIPDNRVSALPRESLYVPFISNPTIVPPSPDMQQKRRHSKQIEELKNENR